MIEIALSEARGNLQDILAWTICLAALIWGAGPERAVALVWLVLFEAVSFAYRSATGASLQVEGIDPFYALIDAAALLCWVAIAIYANRNYALWIAAMQVLAVTAHLARGMVEAIAPVGYVIMIAVPGWFQLLFLAVGLARHIVRQQKYGSYRAWRARRPNISLGGVPTSVQSQPSWREDLK